jgi:hypothetical protein
MGVMSLERTLYTPYKKYTEILSGIGERLNMEHAPLQNLFNRDARYSLADSLRDVQDTLIAHIPQDVISSLEVEGSTALGEIAPEQLAMLRRSLMQTTSLLEPRHALNVTTPSKITRTKLIAAFYHKFLCDMLYLDGVLDYDGLYSFFIDDLNILLEESGFAPMSPKNMFDMTVVFLAYLRFHNKLI